MQIGSSWPHIFWQLALHCNKALTQQILFSSPPALFLSHSVRLLSVPSCIRQEEANCWETEETLVPKEELKKQAPNTNLIVRFDLNVPAHADLLFSSSLFHCAFLVLVNCTFSQVRKLCGPLALLKSGPIWRSVCTQIGAFVLILPLQL